MSAEELQKTEITKKIQELAKSLHASGVSADDALEAIRKQFDAIKRSTEKSPDANKPNPDEPSKMVK